MSRSTTAFPVLAFVVGPLWVPLIVTAVFALYIPHPGHSIFVAFSAIIAALVSYVGTFVIGVPAYLLLRSKGLTSIWIALGLGFVVGVTMSFVVGGLLPLFLGEGVHGLQMVVTSVRQTVGFLMIPGALGVLVGATIWLMARSDRV